MLQRKLFLGARLKRLRRERGLNQSQMADELGISGSYLNHLERNQRPVTAGILLRLAEAFDVDVKAFAVRRRRAAAARPAGRNLLRPDARRPRGQPLRAGRARRQCAVGRRRDCPALHRGARAAAPSRDGEERRRRPALADHARDLGARLYPGAAQPLSRARGSVGDARRRAQPPAVDRRAAAPAAEGGVGSRGPRRRSRSRSRTPASITIRSGGC